MKLFNFLTGALALALGVAVAPAWGQTTEPGITNGSTSVAPAATSPTVPGEKAAPGAPGSSVSADNEAIGTGSTASQSDMLNADYVHKMIDEAQAQGKDVSAARTQEQMGRVALKKGMDDDAVQHFKTALRSIGEMPGAPGKKLDEPASPHRTMQGAMD